jgi:hypothetical protein
MVSFCCGKEIAGKMMKTADNRWAAKEGKNNGVFIENGFETKVAIGGRMYSNVFL